ncbi:MAG: flagellar hook-associated protein FlgL, partial [Clostridiaceae bacterium]|nr:flagellar hook-associated protein FlgL [Clostridiaceae bacterium]
MRITNNMLINNMLNNLNNNLNRMNKYQNQLATGKKISLPSDDPIVASRALKLRTDVAEIQQYKRNVDDANSWMDITETTLGQMNDVMHRARELAVQAGNGTNTPEDLEKIKQEMEQLKVQMVHLANTTYAGRYIFSGFKTDKALMDDNGVFLIDISNSEQIHFEIGIGDDIHINVTGSDLFNNEADASAGDTSGLLATFDALIAALNAG